MLEWLKGFGEKAVNLGKKAVNFVKGHKDVIVPSAMVGTGVMAVQGYASAAIDLTDFSIDLTSIETIVPIILIGSAALWVIRKLFKTTNKT